MVHGTKSPMQTAGGCSGCDKKCMHRGNNTAVAEGEKKTKVTMYKCNSNYKLDK